MGQDDDGFLIFISTPQFLGFDPLVFQGARSFWQLHLKQIIFLLSFSYAAHSFWCLDPRLGRDSIFLFLGHHFLFLFSTSFRWWCNLDFSSIPYMINHRSATWQLHTPSHRFLSLPTLRGLCKYARTVRREFTLFYTTIGYGLLHHRKTREDLFGCCGLFV